MKFIFDSIIYIMYKLKLEVENNSVTARYLEGDSFIIFTSFPISQTSLNEAQSELLLDFTIRQTYDQQKKWNAFEHTLRSIFTNNVVVCKLIPNCILKVNIFVGMAGQNIEAALINCVWSGLLALGVPMQKSIIALESDINNAYIVNLFEQEEVIYGQSSKKIEKGALRERIQSYKNEILQKFHTLIRS